MLGILLVAMTQAALFQTMNPVCADRADAIHINPASRCFVAE